MVNAFYAGMGAAAVIMFIVAFVVPTAESGIPPTNAVQSIEVQTAPSHLVNTTVKTTAYNDKIYFVTDGSVIFNVTDSP